MKISVLLLTLCLLASCSINPYDKAQEPRITAAWTDDGRLEISWKPQNAWHVRVLEGEVDPKDPKHSRPPMLGLMWGLSERDVPVTSPVIYGESQPGTNIHGRSEPLDRSKTYTVYVVRRDPKGSGDGFTNTHNMYEAVQVVGSL